MEERFAESIANSPILNVEGVKVIECTFVPGGDTYYILDAQQFKKFQALLAISRVEISQNRGGRPRQLSMTDYLIGGTGYTDSES